MFSSATVINNTTLSQAHVIVHLHLTGLLVASGTVQGASKSSREKHRELDGRGKLRYCYLVTHGQCLSFRGLVTQRYDIINTITDVVSTTIWHFRRHQVCDMMCASVRQQMILGVNDYLAVDRTQWMQNWPGQIVLNASQVLH